MHLKWNVEAQPFGWASFMSVVKIHTFTSMNFEHLINASKLPDVKTTIFTTIGNLARKHDAISDPFSSTIAIVSVFSIF